MSLELTSPTPIYTSGTLSQAHRPLACALAVDGRRPAGTAAAVHRPCRRARAAAVPPSSDPQRQRQRQLQNQNYAAGVEGLRGARCPSASRPSVMGVMGVMGTPVRGQLRETHGCSHCRSRQRPMGRSRATKAAGAPGTTVPAGCACHMPAASCMQRARRGPWLRERVPIFLRPSLLSLYSLNSRSRRRAPHRAGWIRYAALADDPRNWVLPFLASPIAIVTWILHFPFAPPFLLLSVTESVLRAWLLSALLLGAIWTQSRTLYPATFRLSSRAPTPPRPSEPRDATHATGPPSTITSGLFRRILLRPVSHLLPSPSITSAPSQLPSHRATTSTTGTYYRFVEQRRASVRLTKGFRLVGTSALCSLTAGL